LIDHFPLEIEHPEPMPSPPLRRKPFPMPQFPTADAVASTAAFASVFD